MDEQLALLESATSLDTETVPHMDAVATTGGAQSAWETESSKLEPDVDAELLATGVAAHDAAWWPGDLQETARIVVVQDPAAQAHGALSCRGAQESKSPADLSTSTPRAVSSAPSAVLSAEDAAVTGLRRRGGVEVVVEPVRPASGRDETAISILESGASHRCARRFRALGW